MWTHLVTLTHRHTDKVTHRDLFSKIKISFQKSKSRLNLVSKSRDFVLKIAFYSKLPTEYIIAGGGGQKQNEYTKEDEFWGSKNNESLKQDEFWSDVITVRKCPLVVCPMI